MKIKICKKFSKISTFQRKLAEAFPDDTVIVKKCIDLCKICKHQPTAKVKKQKLKASHIAKLIQKIDDKCK